MRFRLVATVTLIASAIAAQTTAVSAVATCRGHDILVDLKASNPKLFEQIQAEGAALANAEANLWRVERDGLDPSYLMATMHVTDPRITKLPAAAEEALASAQTVAVEVTNVNDQSMGEAMQQMAHRLVFQDGDGLGRHLSDEEQVTLSRVALELGTDSVLLDRMQPWFVGVMLAMPACEQRRLASGLQPLDGLIEAAGYRNGADVVGLESIAEQLESLAGMPFDAQLANLKLTLQSSGRAEDVNETLITLYREHRIGEAWPLMRAMTEDKALAEQVIDEFQLRLIDERNIRMRDRALPLIEKGNAFIAVGALHLPGDKGLVALFREAGYTVTAVE